jgi:hypothetical protein
MKKINDEMATGNDEMGVQTESNELHSAWSVAHALGPILLGALTFPEGANAATKMANKLSPEAIATGERTFRTLYKTMDFRSYPKRVRPLLKEVKKQMLGDKKFMEFFTLLIQKDVQHSFNQKSVQELQRQILQNVQKSGPLSVPLLAQKLEEGIRVIIQSPEPMVPIVELAKVSIPKFPLIPGLLLRGGAVVFSTGTIFTIGTKAYDWWKKRRKEKQKARRTQTEETGETGTESSGSGTSIPIPHPNNQVQAVAMIIAIIIAIIFGPHIPPVKFPPLPNPFPKAPKPPETLFQQSVRFLLRNFKYIFLVFFIFCFRNQLYKLIVSEDYRQGIANTVKDSYIAHLKHAETLLSMVLTTVTGSFEKTIHVFQDHQIHAQKTFLDQKDELKELRTDLNAKTAVITELRVTGEKNIGLLNSCEKNYQVCTQKVNDFYDYVNNTYHANKFIVGFHQKVKHYCPEALSKAVDIYRGENQGGPQISDDFSFLLQAPPEKFTSGYQSFTPHSLDVHKEERDARVRELQKK